jgi:hypothetical protein
LWHDFGNLMPNAVETEKMAAAKMRRETILRYPGRRRCLSVLELLKIDLVENWRGFGGLGIREGV